MLIVAVEYLFILSRKKDQSNDTFIVCDVDNTYVSLLEKLWSFPLHYVFILLLPLQPVL